MAITLQGLRTVIYPSPDIGAAKTWWSTLLGMQPYFDEPFYVGFEVAGYELGLLPDGNPSDGAITYWGTDDVAGAVEAAITQGAVPHAPVVDVGGGIVTGSVTNPMGMIVGFIDNHHFGASEAS
jgi:catechol 2,3-dioxygenase-like lactoylglutathione lyase family enzyme